MANCLITGGCGFIGRHFTKKMVDLGYNVTIVDNMCSNSALLPSNWPKHLKCDYKFVKDDILEYLRTTDSSFDIIIHAAAIVGGRETIENNPLLISYNTTIDNELFRWIEKHSVKNLIYFSSSAVYPISLQSTEYHRKLKLDDIDIQNNNIAMPDLSYGWSKLTGEFLLYILSKRVNTNISIYRPFSGYGEDQHDSYPFPSIMKKVLENNSSIDIWSDAVRDFVYIDDIVNYVLDTCFHNEKIRILNIGTSIPTSMSELANKIAKLVFNKTIKINILNNKPKGVYYRVSDDNSNYTWNSLEYGIQKSLDSGLFN
jgi:nucleoside-diphosphate-sugar epimerase